MSSAASAIQPTSHRCWRRLVRRSVASAACRSSCSSTLPWRRPRSSPGAAGQAKAWANSRRCSAGSASTRAWPPPRRVASSAVSTPGRPAAGAPRSADTVLASTWPSGPMTSACATRGSVSVSATSSSTSEGSDSAIRSATATRRDSSASALPRASTQARDSSPRRLMNSEPAVSTAVTSPSTANNSQRSEGRQGAGWLTAHPFALRAPGFALCGGHARSQLHLRVANCGFHLSGGRAGS
jgi:hypothetical protein